MRWRKLGRIFAPDRHRPWMVSHAANPVVEHLGHDVFRVYFNCRDEANRSHIGYVDVNLREPSRILAVADEPILAPGALGLFDDSGVSVACLLRVNGQRYLYYVGWNLGVTVPWRNSIGLAIFNDMAHAFERVSPAPILDRNAVDPYSVSYPFVLTDGGHYRMWYGSNLAWGARQEDMAHVIKHAQSEDGIHWRRDGQVVLGFKDEAEYALARPCLLKEAGRYRMWYCYRGQAYRIGYAESADGLAWERLDDQVGLDVSETGWDSEMIEYPFVFDHRGERYMLYNGNRYGLTGFGLAAMTQD